MASAELLMCHVEINQLTVEKDRLIKALLKVLPAAEHAYHTGAFTTPDGGDWWAEIKEARAALVGED